MITRLIPALSLAARYQRAWLVHDLAAGAALTAILVPAGMGYAEAAGLPAVNGLYATIVPLLAYAIFGPSRILVLGPDSSLAALIAAAIAPLAASHPGSKTQLAALVAILSGSICMVAGIARFGFVTDLLSKPIRYGYLNGIALTVMASQLPKMLGFPSEGASLPDQLGALFANVAGGRINPVTLAIGAGSMLIILGFRRWDRRIPGVLIAMLLATVGAHFFGWAGTYRIAVAGPLPEGMPHFELPPFQWNEVSALFSASLAIALISFADMSVLSRTFAKRGHYHVDPNHEVAALGLVNIAAGLFQGFPVTSSASRTPVAEAAGARSQLTCVFGALLIAVLLAFAPGLVHDLPLAVLGAVVLTACLGLVEIAEVWRLYRLRSGEFWLSILCFLAVALAGVIPGIFLSIAAALLGVIWRAWRPYTAILGRVDGLKGYHDITRHPEGRQIPGLVLFRWDAPLFFANAGVFEERVLAAVEAAPQPVNWVVVAAEPVTDVDVTAADALAELDAELHKRGCELCFAEMKGPVKDHLKRYGLFSQLGTENFFPTVGQAVDSYLTAHPVAWEDWEDRLGNV